MRLTHVSCFMAALGAMILPATTSMAQPNLTPYKPSGWSDKIVVTTNSTSITDTANLLTTESLYVDWSIINSGTQNATVTFQVNLYVDGTLANYWSLNGLDVNTYEYVTGYSIGNLTAGTHTVEVVADATDVVPNDNESDNSYTKTITVNAVTLLAPTPETPANAATGQPAVPYFTWSPVTDATAYRILIATSSSDLPTSPTATNGGSSVVIDAVSPTTNFSPTITLNPSATYYWEVHANPGDIDDGVWSAIQQFTTQPTPTGLTIVPTFDSSITDDPNAATIEATIKAAISVYQSDFSDQVTARFTYAEMSQGLGDNEAYETIVNYSAYRAALVSHATTADDATVLAHLPSGTDNPVNGNSQVTLKLPVARALGLQGSSSSSDATVYLHTSIMNLSSFTTDPNKYSLFSTVSHEMDEALAFGSILNGLANGAPEPTGPAQPQDLFRYDASGNRSLNTALDTVCYFSFDGTTDIAQFNQYDGGDFGDWYSHDVTVVPQVQDAFLGPGVNPVLGVELRGLDAIGFTRVIPSATPAAAQLSAPAVATGKFIFNLTGSVGGKYLIQSSSNLVTWLTISTNTLPASGSIFITNNYTTGSALFYRTISQ
ncbi:MAG TPA: NF038122 family metalloprotease [Verrucomicrobiae bacterium]|nr:NF038122 family metalloprotease [Verrucomicrobiae bacterium]